MTRHATALDAKRASAALPAGAAANGGGAPRKTLLTVPRMAWGGDRVDKRGLPAEQGKGVNAKETRECNYRPEEGLPRD